MKAIETTGVIDKNGLLCISPLKEKDITVKVIVLVPEEDDVENEDSWLRAAMHSPSFHFLKDPAEEVYTAQSGSPFHD
jgi:uncharacterized protein (DUF1499 family)